MERIRKVLCGFICCNRNLVLGILAHKTSLDRVFQEVVKPACISAAITGLLKVAVQALHVLGNITLIVVRDRQFDSSLELFSTDLTIL